MRHCKLIIIGLLISSGAMAQNAVDAVLFRVEQASQELQAQRELTAAQTLEAKSGNYLQNPTVALESLWGGASNRGNVGELAVVQAFDFPTAYLARNRAAKLKTQFYNTQSLAYRQELLLGAKQICLEIIYLNKQAALLEERLTHTQRLAESYRQKKQAGEATILESNKVEVELILATSARELNTTALANQYKALAILMGEEAESDPAALRLVEYPTAAAMPAFEQLTLLHQQNNPTLQSLSQEKEVNRQNIAVNKAMGLPQFEMGYRRNYGQEGQFNGLVVGMSIPLFENKNKVKAAQAQARFSTMRLQTATANNNRDLRQDYDQTLTLAEATRSLREVVEQQNTLSILNKALSVGELSIINYFTEVNALYTSTEQLLQLEREYQLILARLFRYEL